MDTLDVLWQALDALNLEPERSLQWSHRNAILRSRARVLLRQAIHELEQTSKPAPLHVVGR